MNHVGWIGSELADHTGRTVVITGASAGLGSALGARFAQLGADVVLAVRNVYFLPCGCRKPGRDAMTRRNTLRQAAVGI